ncbi:MAG: hypothetical protein ACREJG_02180 [Candidatus Rokuibacteriota bacterium]
MEASMKKILVGCAALALVALASPAAAANLVELTTSVPVAEARSPETLEASLRDAVERVVAEEIEFTPALVGVVGARVVGDRIHIDLVVADEAGKAMLEEALEAPAHGQGKITI